MKKLILICLLASTVTAAQVQLSGVVLDANSHREVNGVNVYIEQSSYGTVTDKSGAFQLDLPDDLKGVEITFRHISYEIQKIHIDSLRTDTYVYLVPRVIPLPDIEVYGQNTMNKIDVKRDIPQSIKIVDATTFELRGFADAGDLLKTQAAIQVQEEMSGKKTLSVRGGNADDVVMLYNGVRMNSPFDNVFDFSLVDLDNLERFEIIKGSNTSLYGPEAFSGVINVVPQIERDYTLRVHYRLGTYNTEHINNQLYTPVGRQHFSYSFTDASQRRRFIDAASDAESITNNQRHHSANLYANIGKDAALNCMYTHAHLDYANGRDQESVGQTNNIGSVKYIGALGPVQHVHFLAAYKEYDEQQSLNYFDTSMQRRIDDQAFQCDVDKTFKSELFEFLLGYNLKSAHVDFADDRTTSQMPVFNQQAEINRLHHGMVGILKTKAAAGQGFLQNFHVDLSLRHDNLNDTVSGQLESSETIAEGANLHDNQWRATHLKFSTFADGYRQNMAVKAFMNFGSNTKFPTIVQQLSVPLNDLGPGAPLRPEQVTSYEGGVEIFRESQDPNAIDGWHAEAVFFRNYYTDKFRPFSSPGIPVVFYDNIPTAEIFGVEASFNVYIFKKKIDMHAGLAKYQISEKSAFPFKSDYKQTLDVTLNHAGFSVLFHWFHESEQVGWIRTFDGDFAEITLQPFINLDIHISRSFRLNSGKIFVNVSGRNVLKSEETVLQGLAIRDRRAFLTIGAQI
ncbi:TonB-dependent receptor [candidate division KSB1 bacterium]|nr:TonB-dependent receptor [candidate division KSB1 bacterium]RQW06094.1 MAG: TonB-dependent receptor [candidate division KSB1 bacterium]